MRGLSRIGLERRGQRPHRVQGVQMIEVDHVILDHLGAGDQVAHNARVFGNLDLQRVFDGADAGQGVQSSQLRAFGTLASTTIHIHPSMLNSSGRRMKRFTKEIMKRIRLC